ARGFPTAWRQYCTCSAVRPPARTTPTFASVGILVQSWCVSLCLWMEMHSRFAAAIISTTASKHQAYCLAHGVALCIPAAKDLLIAIAVEGTEDTGVLTRFTQDINTSRPTPKYP